MYFSFIVVSVLVTSCSCSGSSRFSKNNHVIEYVTNLERIYKFRTFVFFHAEAYNQDELCKHIEETLTVPIISLTRYPDVPLNKFVGNSTLSLVFIESISSKVLPVVDKTLRGIHYLKIAFIFPAIAFETGKIQLLFRWCWERGMVNVNALFVKTDGTLFIYSYDPFQQDNLLNLTQNSAEDFFPNKMKDFKGYKFRSPVQEDMPRVLTYVDSNGRKDYDGIGGRIFTNFIKRHNGTFEELHIANSTHSVEIQTILQYVFEKKIDISMHPYGSFNRSRFGASYPYMLTRYCFVVPVRKQVPPYMYLIKPFKISTWAAIVCSIFYISTCLFLSSVITQQQKDFGHALCNCLCGILNISMPLTSFPSTKRSLLIYGQVFLLGFVLSNLYLTKLLSFLTKPYYGRQLETLDEIYNSGLKILIVEYETLSIRGSSNFPQKYEDIFLLTDADTVASHFIALNASYGYAMTTEQWTLYLQQQDYMERKRLRATNVCFGQYLVSFPMQFDSPFAELLSQFILELHAAGIYHHWRIQIFEKVVKLGILHRIRDITDTSPKPLNLENLTLMWYIFLCGNLSAFCGFLLEHVRFWYSKHYCDQCNKLHLHKCKL